MGIPIIQPVADCSVSCNIVEQTKYDAVGVPDNCEIYPYRNLARHYYHKTILSFCSIKVPKAYPSYFGGYKDFDTVRSFTDSIDNLFLVGRNGMHRYNNTDHSMLTAMAAVDNIISGITDKANIWEINTDDEYHEEAARS